ncbi:putative ATPase [Natronocella acetinitrilica]|uniref:Replication-associated recombination protein A n=1 Tax=Natronocella acetinitrilica TaxID=414046 RepID=A0AAE3G2U6_9GAMM|nr:replication-associated recombination protein A [Natronocella acetinitrilica]MCP1674619.1 putative ATPase [Natronocella acetinitrilica]
MDLFEQLARDDFAPLAERMRPRSLDEVVGQEALCGPGGPLRRMVDAGVVRSMVLWAPPGVGKTTLARILARGARAELTELSAVEAGVKDIRAVAERARAARGRGARSVLLLDEIHRFSRAQQDALLPHVESGLIVLIGATTENVAFSLNQAVLSRLAVFTLGVPDDAAIRAVLLRALADAARGLGGRGLRVADPLLDRIAASSGGDVRRALGVLELACDQADAEGVVSDAALDAAIGHGAGRMDRAGDAHYDLLSAIHKSVRSSRVDAALLYIAHYIGQGGDPLDVVRRLCAIASEDVGLADTRALPLVIAAWDAYLRLGDHEGQRAIAHAAVHLALAPKSDSVDRAWSRARHLAAAHPALSVPLALRNAPHPLMAALGHGDGYLHAHATTEGYPAGEAHDGWPQGVPRETLYQGHARGSEAGFVALERWRRGLDTTAQESPP